jgi:colanic acid/amylovoran biosynthesis glycosyltransferase
VNRVLIFAERMLPSTQTFIPIQVDALQRFEPQYAGLIPAEKNFALKQTPILLTKDRTLKSRMRRESYRWTGVAPAFHARLKQTGAKLMHAHFAEAASSAVSISEALRIPFVFHLRGGAEMMSDAELRKKAFQLPYLLWRQRLWERASMFLCVSSFIRDKALQAGFPAHKTRVHYTGIDMTRFSPSDSPAEPDKNLVLYVGRLVAYKGADHLIRAMHTVRLANSAAHLVVIGEGTLRPELERLASSLGVPCQFLGEQPWSVVRTWLERARVFCGPSLTLPDGMSEAFGNVFTEAQAMGVPVVSYRHGGIPEAMLDGKTGLLADERDEKQLAANLSRYLSDANFWASSRELGMRWVRENFDVLKQTAKLETLYDEVIGGAAKRIAEAA